MRRVVVLGSGGAGKSTLADTLGRILDVPAIHLDEHYWKPGWIATPEQEWRARQQGLLAGDRWISDGNYSSTVDLRLKRADTVVLLMTPRWKCLLRIVTRWAKHHGEPIHAADCPERLTPTFIRWVWNYPTSGRARVDAALAATPSTANTIELTGNRDVQRFLKDVASRAGHPTGREA